MTVLGVLKIVGAVTTIIAGLASAVAPESITGFTGLAAAGSRGISEIRAVLGGVFIGVGAAPFILREPTVYRVLGVMYLFVAAVRLVSMFVDGALQSSNYISLAYEVFFGIVFLL
jgi:hypothetical protein